MAPNFIVLALAALIPLIVGFAWYNPKVFGHVWIKNSGKTQEELKAGNLLVIFGLTYLFGLFLALALFSMVIHQAGLYSMVQGNPDLNDPASKLSETIKFLMDNYGQNFRTFKHGVLHGIIGALFVGLPLIGITALFERRGASYIFVHLGYWMLTMALMGGIICQFA